MCFPWLPLLFCFLFTPPQCSDTDAHVFPAFWDWVPLAAEFPRGLPSFPVYPWQLFNFQQFSLTWIIAFDKQPPYGQPGRLWILAFRNAPIHHAQFPSKCSQSAHTKSWQIVLSQIHSGCHHTKQGSVSMCVVFFFFLISCLSFNLTNIYWAEPNRGPGLGVAMDPEVGERKSLPFWSIWSGAWLKGAHTHLAQMKHCAFAVFWTSGEVGSFSRDDGLITYVCSYSLFLYLWTFKIEQQCYKLNWVKTRIFGQE